MYNGLLSFISRFKIWIGYFVSIIALIIAFNQIEWNKLWEITSGLDLVYLLVGCVFTQLEMICGVWRWGSLIKPLKNIRFMVAYRYFMIGYLFNQILPARPGEIIRSVLLAQKFELSKIGILSLSIVEKVADVCCLAALMIILTFLVEISRSILLAGVVCGVLSFIILLVLFIIVNIKIDSISHTFIKNILPPKLINILDITLTKCVKGMAALNSVRSIAVLLLSTLCLWLCGIVVTYIILLSFNINLPWYVSMFVLVVTNLGMMVPSSPGAIGVAHLLYIIALVPFGVDKTTALAFGVVIHGVSYLQVIVIGILCLLKEKIGFKKPGTFIESNIE